jgi:glycosyltransferase involved in cell wall biosynthesis
MRVAIFHSRYLSGSVSGENRVVEDEARVLGDGGHDVDVWTPSPPDGGAADLVRAGIDAVWSRAAVKETRRRIEAFEPDIVHCHNLFPALSPAVMRVCEQLEVPVVVTLHNYRLLCTPGTFLRDGKICEDCLGHSTWRSVVYGCHRDSALASAALSTSISVHRAIGTFSAPSMYFAVSGFLRDKHVQGGLPADRIMVKSNFAWPSPRRQGSGDYFLYLGRLAPEKGVATLMRAFEDVPVELRVVGDGPQREELESMAPGNVRFTGAVDPKEVEGLLTGARAVLVPSEWYEGQPRTILEAYAAGVPVVASRIGGLPELVHDGVTGLVRDPGDVLGWTDAARRLSDDRVAADLGHGAYRAWEASFGPHHGLAALEDAYRSVLEGSPAEAK